ncbi:MAG: single-stranded-DNA-specific exonuclease RecJ [Bacteroidia bacterium]|nr:single-stranded-DNA-specific exonuclease RecJ [Bacteroidia bacterium]
MEFIWKEKTQPDRRKIEHLSNLLNIPEKIATLLVQRGVETYDQAEAFFKPKFSQLYDPYLMKDMERAVERIENALQHGEKILIYGDYDVDGTTSVATVYSFLRELWEQDKIDYYIPDRYKEGYGVSKIGIDWAKTNGFSLIIALDCGTRSIELIHYAKTLDIDFIVCDHHLPGEELPETVALLNPKQAHCAYPYKELSGCGIGFKLIQAIAHKRNMDESKVMQYLDLVAVSIASDIVDMMDENRVLMYLGLEKLNSNPCVGLQALMQSYIIKDNYEVGDIVFGLGPRINASGRISDAKDSVKLLIETDFHQAIKAAKVLDEHNSERKDKDSDITKEALELIQNNEEYLRKRTTVLYGNQWHKGVIGIVASRLIEYHYKPTIIFSENDGMLTGSARSVKEFDIHEAIGSCGEYVLQYGGHKYAAGLSVKKEHFDAFALKFEQVVQSTITEDAINPSVEYDTELDFSDINDKFMRLLDRFKPFGPGNMSPVFRSNKIKDIGNSRVLKKKHLRIVGKQSGVVFDGIGFNMADKYSIVRNQEGFDCCYSLEWNNFNGRVSIQLKLKDIRA